MKGENIMRYDNHKTILIRPLLLCLTAILLPGAFVSCSSVDDPEGEPGPVAMSFKADFGLTREGTVTVDSSYRLWLSAMHQGEGGGALFFNGADRIELDYNGSNSKFEATGWYYPLSGTMDFLSYASNASGSRLRPEQYPWVDILTEGGSFSGMLIDLTDGSTPGTGDDEDNTRAEATSGDREFDGSYEVMYALPVTGHECGPYAQEPTLHFKHPMVNLRFHFQAADEATTKHVRINYIQIRNARVKGKCLVSTDGSFEWADVRDESDKIVWVNNFNPGEEGKGNIPYSATDSSVGLDAGNGVYLIPQSDRNSDQNRTQIVVNYTMYNDQALHVDDTNQGWNNGHIGEKNEETGETTTDWGYGEGGFKDDDVRNLFYVVQDELDFDWEAGNCYIYHIYVRGNCQMDLIDVNVKPIEDAEKITPMNI